MGLAAPGELLSVPALHRGQRGRHNQGGYFGSSPQGMPHQRQNQQRSSGIGSQNGEAHSSMPVGTKLQGHVETVKDKFGFIRCDASLSWCAHILARNIKSGQGHLSLFPGNQLLTMILAMLTFLPCAPSLSHVL